MPRTGRPAQRATGIASSKSIPTFPADAHPFATVLCLDLEGSEHSSTASDHHAHSSGVGGDEGRSGLIHKDKVTGVVGHRDYEKAGDGNDKCKLAPHDLDFDDMLWQTGFRSLSPETVDGPWLHPDVQCNLVFTPANLQRAGLCISTFMPKPKRRISASDPAPEPIHVPPTAPARTTKGSSGKKKRTVDETEAGDTAEGDWDRKATEDHASRVQQITLRACHTCKTGKKVCWLVASPVKRGEQEVWYEWDPAVQKWSRQCTYLDQITSETATVSAKRSSANAEDDDGEFSAAKARKVDSGGKKSNSTIDQDPRSRGSTRRRQVSNARRAG